MASFKVHNTKHFRYNEHYKYAVAMSNEMPVHYFVTITGIPNEFNSINSF